MKSLGNQKSIIVVLGMHRSGTSLITKSIITLGADPGSNLMLPGEDNPKGFWEDLDIYDLNEKILDFLFFSWNKKFHLPFNQFEYFLPLYFDKFAPQAIEILNRKLEQNNVIIIKDPRISILLPFWNKVFSSFIAEIKYIFCIRNPLAVSNSIISRNNLKEKGVLDLWSFYNLLILNTIENDFLVVEYEKFIESSDSEIERIAQYVKLPYNSFIPEVSSFKEEYIDKGLNHFHFIEEGLREKIFNYPDIFSIYNLLKDFSSGDSQNPLQIRQTQKELLESFFRFQNVTNEHDEIDISFQIGYNREYCLIQNVLFDSNNYFDREYFFKIDFLSNSIRIELGNKPCLFALKGFSINNGKDEASCHISGNFIFNNGSIFIFSNNNPFMVFDFNEICNMLIMKMNGYFLSDQNVIANLIIPVLNNEFDQKNIIKGELELHKNKISEKENENLELINLIKSKVEKHNKVVSALNKQIFEDNCNIESLKCANNQLDVRVNQKEEENVDLNNSLHRLKNQVIDKDRIIFQQKIEIEELLNQISALKKSFSWRLSLPLRLIGNILLKVLSPFRNLIQDIGFGIELFKREGIKQFIYRSIWYIRGKRLNEDIFFEKNKIELKNKLDENSTYFYQLVFPVSKKPLVSIVIPVYNQWEYTYKCLQSILENTSDVDYEVIIANDLSTDETKNIDDYVKNIKILCNSNNLKFLRNCNNAAKYAIGKYIHFLNNDVVVHPKWLSSLISLAEQNSDIGIVGSKLIYPDGRLQEAGGIIWNDATGWNFGRLDDPEKPEYNYVKETDYVSGASLLISKDLWDKLGGFDELFFPAYFEDTDLAFRVRQLGYKVVYQPLSVITHFEGISHGTDENSGQKRYQTINRQKFLDRWKEVLNTDHFNNAQNVFLARDRSKTKKQVLVIDHYVPHFDSDAGSRSTFSYVKLLVEMRFNVKFIGDNFFRHEPYTTILQQMGIEVLYGNFYATSVNKWIIENGHYFDIVIVHRMHIAPKYLDVLKKHTHAKLAYVGHDLQFLSSQRKYELTQELSYKQDVEKFKSIEKRIFNTVDIILPFSSYEAPYITKIVPDKIVKTIPVFFFDNVFENKYQFNERKDILFVGGFGHPPNVDGICWFVKEIFPLVQKANEGIKLYIVGSKPTEEVKGLVSDSIIVTGYISDEELGLFYNRCKVAVLPLRYGAGVKGKLLEALYHQIPTVITEVAAEGVPDIEEYSLISRSPIEFAENINILCSDEQLWHDYSSRGKELILKNYSKEAAKKILSKIF